MATKNCELRLLNDKEVVLCSINTVTYYDDTNEFDEGETFYIHPLTGSECQTVGQILQGWSEQNEEDNNNWNKLIEEIRSDEELIQKIFNVDTVDYYA